MGVSEDVDSVVDFPVAALSAEEEHECNDTVSVLPSEGSTCESVGDEDSIRGPLDLSKPAQDNGRR